jgi:hypothetical protein
MSDQMEGLEEVSDKEAARQMEELQGDAPGLAALVHDRFYVAETARRDAESRWLQSYNDFRGIYPNGITFRETEKSRVFIKIAKTKTLAAYGQLVEVVFAGNKFPIGIKPTPKPVGIAEKAHLEGPDEPEIDPMFDVGFAGDGEASGWDKVMGGLKTLYNGAKFSAGPSKDPGKPDISPAMEAALNMEKTIHDQLGQTDASRELRKALFESVLYGTGVIKGPFSAEKVLHRWNMEEDEDSGKTEKMYDPVSTIAPKIECTSVWNLYPDPAAENVEECEYIIERHKMNRSQVRALAKRPFFNKEALRVALLGGPNWSDRGHEDALGDNTHDYSEQSRWEILEYWGIVDAQLAVEAGADIDLDKVDPLAELQMNVWVYNDTILRMVVNPFEPERLPYNIFPYEVNPHEFFGVGVPENMADNTQIMNGHMRMAIDNLAISGNVILDVDESSLVAGQSKELYPGKVFERQSGAPGQSIYAIKIPNTTQANMEMFDKSRQLADESTGIPSYSHGTTGVQSTTRTAAGMSMLMGAASLATKTSIKNLDDYLLKPLGEDFFHWNMQFNPDVTVHGDLEVSALGTEAIMQKEVRSQRLTQFMQAGMNPMSGPFLNIQYLMKEIAKSLELDPEEAVNDMEKAKLFAEIYATANPGGGAGGEQSPMMGHNGGPAMSSNGLGDGAIGAGNAAQPGEDNFSGVKQGGE